MYVAHQCENLRVRGDEQRFVAVLEEVPHPVVTQIERLCIARVYSGHHLPEGYLSRSQDEVYVIRHEGPRVTAHSRFGQDPVQSSEQIPIVALVVEEMPSLYSAQQDVMHATRGIDTWPTRHLPSPAGPYGAPPTDRSGELCSTGGFPSGNN